MSLRHISIRFVSRHFSYRESWCLCFILFLFVSCDMLNCKCFKLIYSNCAQNVYCTKQRTRWSRFAPSKTFSLAHPLVLLLTNWCDNSVWFFYTWVANDNKTKRKQQRKSIWCKCLNNCLFVCLFVYVVHIPWHTKPYSITFECILFMCTDVSSAVECDMPSSIQYLPIELLCK